MTLLAKGEVEKALRYYIRGWSLQEITENILEARNAGIRHEMLKEVGAAISKRFQRQMYPVKFYGKLKIEGVSEEKEREKMILEEEDIRVNKETGEVEGEEIKIRYVYLGSPTNMRNDPAYHETLRFTVLTIAELELRPNRIDFEELVTTGMEVIIRILGRDRGTGLRDVEGEEIFENDIIRWYPRKPKNHTDYAVEYCGNLFWLGGWEENDYPDTTKWCEIIGTTYDNKFKVVAEG